MIYHDSRNEFYRFPTGAAACGSTVRLRVKAENIERAYLRVWWADGEQLYEMSRDGDTFACALPVPETPGLLWYCFKLIEYGGAVCWYGNARDGLGGAGEQTACEPSSYQMTVYRADYQTPEWMRNGAMMQIMVDRFHASKPPDIRNLPTWSYYHRCWDEDPVLVINDRSDEYSANDFFGGDLKGIEEKLSYIADLGVTVIYLNPIFKANSNHKYNTGDYREIDPTFGTRQDFIDLCLSAKRKGIKIILDGVFSHTGSDSLYFNKNKTYGSGGAYNDPNSPYASWYKFKAWPDDYASWWGFKTLPEVDKNAPSYRDFIYASPDSVVEHWLKLGASGWRLDVADELPMDFIAGIRATEKRVNPDAALIGEVWEDPTNKVSYGQLRCYCTGETLDSAMNYPLRDAILSFMLGHIDANAFVRRVEAMRESQPKPFFYAQMNLLGSHDRGRALSVLADVGDTEPDKCLRKAFDLAHDDYARGRRRLIAAWTLICALPGMPCVYYGDEAGLYGMTDPFCRGTYPWGREDKLLQDAFRDALHRRMSSPALKTGDMVLRTIGADVVIIERSITNNRDAFGNPFENETVALAVNRADGQRQFDYNGKTFCVDAQCAAWL